MGHLWITRALACLIEVGSGEFKNSRGWLEPLFNTAHCPARRGPLPLGSTVAKRGFTLKKKCLGEFFGRKTST